MNKRGEENRSVRHTRRRLQEAMVTLLKQKSVDAITVRELTELADVNRSTFYLHYQDVYDLLEQMEQRAVDELREFLTLKNLEDLRGGSPAAMKAVFAHLAQNRERFVVLFGPNGRREAKQWVLDTGITYVIQVATQVEGVERTPALELWLRYALEGGLGVLEKYYLQEEPAEVELLSSFFTRITEVIFRGYLDEIQS